MKFFADECIYFATIKMLRKLGYDVETVTEQKLESQDDEKIFEYAKKSNRILLTFDKDFGNIFRFPLGSHPGIIIVRLKPQTPEETNHLLRNFLKETIPADISRALVVIGKEKVRIRKPAV